MAEPTIKEIGRRARKIDLCAFTLSMEKNNPDRSEAITRRMVALETARAELEAKS